MRPQKIKVNKNVLGSILADNIRTNSRMDRMEVDKANLKLREISAHSIRAKLMSEHLNN